MHNVSFWKLNGFEDERLLYVLGVFKLHKKITIIAIPKNSLLNKFIISFLQGMQAWYCTYKIILMINKINTMFRSLCIESPWLVYTWLNVQLIVIIPYRSKYKKGMLFGIKHYEC